MSKSKKSIQTIVNEAVIHGQKLYESGDLDFAPTSIDVMVALIIESSKGKLAYRNKEVTDFVAPHEEICKYAKPVGADFVEYLHSKF